jgi:glycosyltransferase involved in cell wall biosynthesis
MTEAPGPKPTVVTMITRLIVGGAQETAILTAEGLRSRYHSILVAGPQTGPEGELHSEAAERGVAPLIVDSLVREISVTKDPVALYRLWRFLRRERPQVVHTHSSKAGIVGRLAARLAGVPVIVHTVHGWPFHEASSRPARTFYVLLERAMAPLTDALIVVAARDMEAGLAARVGRREQYRLVPNGIDLDPLLSIPREPSDNGKPPVVGSVMRLSEQKDPATLMEAAAHVLQRHPEVRFVVAGDGPLRPALESLSERLGLGERFRFLGIQRDLRSVLGSFDIFAATSRWEGMPRAVISAMASGLPVVAADVGGISEVVADGENGFLFPVGDVHALSERLVALIDAPEQRMAFGRTARRRVAGTDVSTMIQRTEEIYEDLLRRKGLQT